MNQDKGKKKVNGKDIGAIKREKFRLKQLKKMQVEREDNDKSSSELTCFLREHSDFTKYLSLDDAIQISSKFSDPPTKESEIHQSRKRRRPEEVSDEQCDNISEEFTNLMRPYYNLKETRTEDKDQDYFIAEGSETVRVLLEQSSKDTATNGNVKIQLRSILTKPSPFFEDPVNLKKTLETSFPTFQNIPFTIIVGHEKAISDIIGFHLARGALACGVIPSYDDRWLQKLLMSKKEQQEPIRILALDQICDTANLGSLLRSSAAFGITAVILSDNSCNVWSRRCVRVSMGHCINVPSLRVSNLSKTIHDLNKQFQTTSYAAVIDKSADMILEKTKQGQISKNWCLVLGNEGNGISQAVIQSCNHRLRVAMADGVDSLSVGVAAGILLHGLKEREISTDPK
jgi:tRNA G18 (ribose-2'-O)-methylase SpoU